MLKKILEELLIAVLVAVILAVGSVVCYTGYKIMSDPLVKEDDEIKEIREKARGESGEETESAEEHVPTRNLTDEYGVIQDTMVVEDSGPEQHDEEVQAESQDVSQMKGVDGNSSVDSEDGAEGRSINPGSEVSVYGLTFALPSLYTWQFNLEGNGYYFRPDENTYSPILTFHSVSAGDQEINDSSYQDVMDMRVNMLKSKLGEGWEVTHDENTTVNGVPCRKFATKGTDNGQEKVTTAFLLYSSSDGTIAEVDFSINVDDDYSSRSDAVSEMINSVQ